MSQQAVATAKLDKAIANAEKEAREAQAAAETYKLNMEARFGRPMSVPPILADELVFTDRRPAPAEPQPQASWSMPALDMLAGLCCARKLSPNAVRASPGQPPLRVGVPIEP